MKTSVRSACEPVLAVWSAGLFAPTFLIRLRSIPPAIARIKRTRPRRASRRRRARCQRERSALGVPHSGRQLACLQATCRPRGLAPFSTLHASTLHVRDDLSLPRDISHDHGYQALHRDWNADHSSAHRLRGLGLGGLCGRFADAARVHAHRNDIAHAGGQHRHQRHFT